MFAAILPVVFKWLGTEALALISNFVTAELKTRADIRTGQTQQASAETATSLNTETKIAQAETDTDRSVVGMEAAAKDGKF